MDSDLAWAKWGIRDPYFGVLTDTRYRAGHVARHRQDFFESGERHVAEVMRNAAPFFVDERRTSMLDFGCGVGRLLLPFAKEFATVAGVDVSAGMLAEAARNAAQGGYRNIELFKDMDDLPGREGTYELAHSYIVFQHIPVMRGMLLMKKLARMVRAGGVVAVHVCVADVSGSGRRLLKGLRGYVPGMRQAINVCRARPLLEPPMEMNVYDMPSVLQLLKLEGYGAPRVDIEGHGDFLTATFIARRDIIPT